MHIYTYVDNKDEVGTLRAKLIAYSAPSSDLDALTTHHILSEAPHNPRTDGQSGALVRFWPILSMHPSYVLDRGILNPWL